MSDIALFADLFERVSRPVDLTDEGEFPLVGLHLNGQGAFLREIKPGLSIKKKRHFVIRANDIIYNKLFAWRGSFSVVGAELDGYFVSDKFPTYRLKRDDVSLDYLSVVFRAEALAKQAEQRSVGSAAMSKFTLNPPRFMELRCLVPSMDEQNRIVNLVRQLDDEMIGIHAAMKRLATYCGALIPRFVDHACEAVPEVPLGRVGKLTRRSVTISDGETYRQVTIAMNNRGVRLRGEKTGYQIAVKNQAFVRAGDVVFSRIDIRNGAIGIVPKHLDGAVVANDFPVYVLDDALHPGFAELAFKTPRFREQCISKSAGSTNRRKMRRNAFLDLTVPCPEPAVQCALIQQSSALDEGREIMLAACKRMETHAEGVIRKMINHLIPPITD